MEGVSRALSFCITTAEGHVVSSTVTWPTPASPSHLLQATIQVHYVDALLPLRDWNSPCSRGGGSISYCLCPDPSWETLLVRANYVSFINFILKKTLVCLNIRLLKFLVQKEKEKASLWSYKYTVLYKCQVNSLPPDLWSLLFVIGLRDRRVRKALTLKSENLSQVQLWEQVTERLCVSHFTSSQFHCLLRAGPYNLRLPQHHQLQSLCLLTPYSSFCC